MGGDMLNQTAGAVGLGKVICPEKMLTDGQAWFDKFVIHTRTCWVEFLFEDEIEFRAYGLRSANAYPNRNPSQWKLSVKRVDSDEWEILH